MVTGWLEGQVGADFDTRTGAFARRSAIIISASLQHGKLLLQCKFIPNQPTFTKMYTRQNQKTADFG